MAPVVGFTTSRSGTSGQRNGSIPHKKASDADPIKDLLLCQPGWRVWGSHSTRQNGATPSAGPDVIGLTVTTFQMGLVSMISS